MVKLMGVPSLAIAAVALAALFVAPNSSLAASKKHNFSDKTQCLGGGCTAENPDRTRNLYTSFYKKSKKKKSTASTTNH
jgi:hypothetical protein